MDMVIPARELKPGSVGWSVDDIFNDPELRWRWDTSRWELLDGVVVAPGFGPETATRLLPGSTDWTVQDLERQPFKDQWAAGRYELIDGVIAELPPPALSHSYPVTRLVNALDDHCQRTGFDAIVASEVDLVISHKRRFIADAVLLSRPQLQAERDHPDAQAEEAGWFGAIRTPPTLVIESISLGHEKHDLTIKHQAYAKFGIEHYWVLNGRDRTIRCFRLETDQYVENETCLRGGQFVPEVFNDFQIPLNKIFLDLD